jgi:putative transposase
MVCVANIHDSKAALLFMPIIKEFLSSIKVVIADGGYSGECQENIWLCN